MQLALFDAGAASPSVDAVVAPGTGIQPEPVAAPSSACASLADVVRHELASPGACGYLWGWADTSVDGAYVYQVGRRWASMGDAVLFILLCPGADDGLREHGTTTRCAELARALGCGAMRIVHLFARRTQLPHELRDIDDPVGPHNDRVTRQAAGHGGVVVAAWDGTPPGLRERSAAVLATIDRPVMCMGLTNGMEPVGPFRTSTVRVHLQELWRPAR
jgi:hypothetical protein